MEVKWSGDYITVVSPKNSGYEAIHSSDSVMALPVVGGDFIVRKEPLPAYMVQGGEQKYWTVLSGGVEGDESPLQALKREVEEEAGIRLSRIKVFERKERIPYVKHTTQRVSFYFFEALEYEEMEPPGDGSEIEENSETHRVGLSELKNLSNKENADFLLNFVTKCAEARYGDT
jgi:8-oxo-dGTP pyrophosphatase MutT (NUDIX family)